MIQKKNQQLTIVHAGTFYPRFKPYAFLYAIAAWRSGKYSTDVPPFRENTIKVVLLGARDAQTNRIVQELEISDIVEIKSWVAQKEAQKIMCRADLLLATLGTGVESSTYMPSKIFEYIAAKRPVIGFFHKGEAESLINETNIGIVFTKDDSDAVIKFIYEMIKTKEKGLPVSYKPDVDKVKKYHIRSIVLKLRDNLENIVSSK